jgi:hypothetical protein
MESFLPEIRSQLRAATNMLKTLIDQCPDELWEAQVGEFRFFEECFHVACFLDLLTQEWEPFTPLRFGKHEIPDKINWTKANLKEWIETSIGISEGILNAESFQAMKTAYPEFSEVEEVTRALEIMRHTQHHVGRLTEFLESKGIIFKNWE